jgi:thioredoxin-dependent peroxiredoxin
MAKITLKGNPINTNGELPAMGSQAPAFTLIDPELKEISLSDFKGKRKLIYAVPSLDTSVCLLSTKKLNDEAKKHPEMVFIVISGDLPFAQKRACGLEHIENIKTLSFLRSKDQYPKAYGMLIIDGPLQGLSARAVLALDEEDKVIYRELIPEITQEPDFPKIFKNL